mmetsp:Transcript_22646/g.73620  ORF Transcript_22646/g.73620 Transcript_22646/m.73620 type:complete len:263 (+) Transcript_22646:914-1702(+)
MRSTEPGKSASSVEESVMCIMTILARASEKREPCRIEQRSATCESIGRNSRDQRAAPASSSSCRSSSPSPSASKCCARVKWSHFLRSRLTIAPAVRAKTLSGIMLPTRRKNAGSISSTTWSSKLKYASASAAGTFWMATSNATAAAQPCRAVQIGALLRMSPSLVASHRLARSINETYNTLTSAYEERANNTGNTNINNHAFEDALNLPGSLSACAMNEPKIANPPTMFAQRSPRLAHISERCLVSIPRRKLGRPIATTCAN